MKKFIKYFSLMIVCAFLASPVYAACSVNKSNNITGCSVLGNKIQIDAKIAETVSVVVLVIQVVVPVVLVIFGMLDLVKAVIASKEDEIKKAQMTFVKRLIAAALVFFVFVIVKLVISLVATDNTAIMNCANCFLNGPGK